MPTLELGQSLQESNQSGDSTDDTQQPTQQSTQQSTQQQGQQVNSATTSTSSIQRQLNVEQLMRLANKSEFPKKLYIIEGKERLFSPVLNFFNSQNVFDQFPSGNIDFKCVICSENYQAKLNTSSNLFKHLTAHTETKTWHRLYKEKKNNSLQNIDDATFDLIIFFITNDVSLIALQTDSLRNLLKRATINLPSYWTFRHTLLPSVLDKVTARIESRLKSADTICLITDIWTNRNNTDFIALGASFTDKYFDRDILVISMIPMKGNIQLKTSKYVSRR